eukprot:6186299-Pleurochrysis_carterae.AAC.1
MRASMRASTHVRARAGMARAQLRAGEHARPTPVKARARAASMRLRERTGAPACIDVRSRAQHHVRLRAHVRVGLSTCSRGSVCVCARV